MVTGTRSSIRDMGLRHRSAWAVAALGTAMIAWGGSAARGEVGFVRDIQPILARKCFACHGPDDEARQAKLRLDTAAGATADRGGYQAVVPGKPQLSELYLRITSEDKTDRMPPRQSKQTLSQAEIDLIRQWIEQGGEYETHWAFVPPTRPTPPVVSDANWARQPFDRFVLARLEAEGLRPSRQADRHTLVRRVYLDLIGLPPTPTEADAFVNDSDPRAYEKLVDRLLASPHYGERWARLWLDLARYADTNGYEKDRPRSIWPYRDWVIEALNADMPYDRFTIEQIAGDMVPDATAAQRIATGFHRNTMLNEEGGIDPLEFRFHAMVDRVATTGVVWMGLTTGCAQCHSHKYDPISHTDYYKLMGLLNNADEPDLIVPDEAVAKRRDAIEAQIAKLEADLPNQFPPADGEGPIEQRREQHLETAFAAWLDRARSDAVRWTTIRPTKMTTNLPRLEVLEDGSIFSTGDITKRDVFTLTFRLPDDAAPVTALRLEVLPDDRLPQRGPGRAYYEGRKGDFFLSELTAKVNGAAATFTAPSHSYGKISIGSGADAKNVIDGEGSTGWSTAQREGEAHQLVLNFARPTPGAGAGAVGAELVIEMLFERHFAASLGRFRLSVASADRPVSAKDMPVEIESLLTRQPRTWTEADRAALKRQFLLTTPHLAEARKRIEQLRKQMPDFPTTMVMQERPSDNPRPTFRHHRGEYLSTKEPVEPGLPQLFAGMTARQPTNRLEFARWLVSRDNTLAARVAVNRAWRAFFGHGIVRTSGDFGTQSDPPTHPQMLDWLAVEFMDGGWSMKKLHRLIVTSATYRQRSALTPQLLARDPQNRLLARGPRVRVDAEMVRDIMLRGSGLLSDRMGGPSVYPPQPASVTALAYGNTAWSVSKGEDRYRRSLYTYSKRTAPFAAYTVFDGPTGEQCIPRRDRSNTPLQALTLLNDEMYLEMSRALARQAMKDTAQTDEQRATIIFRRLLTRPPGGDELRALLGYRSRQLARLNAGELKADAIAADKQADAELASWMMLARVVMNLDEAITKQ